MGHRKYGAREKRIVIETYKETGSGIKAAKAAGVSTAWAYRRLQKAGLTKQVVYSEELADRAERLYVDEGLACSKVADRLGTSDQWVYEKMRDRGVLRGKNYVQHPVRYLDYKGTEVRLQGPHSKEIVREVLEGYDAGLVPEELSEEFDGIPPQTIEKWVAKAGIRRSHSEAHANRQAREGMPTHVAVARIAERLYVEEEMSTGEIAERTGRCQATIMYLLRRRGVELRSKEEANYVRWHGSLETYKKFCRRAGHLYHREDMTLEAIAEELGMTYRTVKRALESKHNPYSRTVEREGEDDWWVDDDTITPSQAGLSIYRLPAR